MSLCYLYDGSFDGLLTVVFQGHASQRHPDHVAEEEGLQVGFGQEVVPVETDEKKARRVERGITGRLGQPVYEKVWTVYLSSDPGKATAIYNYLRHGFAVGRDIAFDLAHPDVLALDALHRLVGRESHLLKEFLRFSQMENGVFYARITPEHCVVPLLMPHFVDRYCVQPFLIHDATHGLAGVYDLQTWRLVEAGDLTLPPESCDELEFKRMWKRFYDTIAIRERINPRCRMNHMPKKYWKNMPEFNFVETPKTRRRNTRGAVSR